MNTQRGGSSVVADDMVRESVPGTSSGDWKSSITDDWQPCTTDRQWWRRRWS